MSSYKWGRKFLWRRWFNRCSLYIHPSPAAGFTLPEVLIVVVIAGILAAITAVSWQSFWHSRLLTAAQDEVFQAMRQAQVQAQHTQSSWQASFQTANGSAQWSVHQPNAPSAQIYWQVFDSRVEIADSATTLPRSGPVYRVGFDHQGHVPPPFGRLTLQIKNGGTSKRCVFVSTLLGALRKSNSCDVAEG